MFGNLSLQTDQFSFDLVSVFGEVQYGSGEPPQGLDVPPEKPENKGVEPCKKFAIEKDSRCRDAICIRSLLPRTVSKGGRP
jgi:hypothetical protein